jgi:hypothetical protein
LDATSALRGLRLAFKVAMDSALRIVGCLATVSTLAFLPHCLVKTESCTEVGCGLSFGVELARSTWTPGDYEINVTADGLSTSCAVTLPFSSCSTLVTCDRADPGFQIETAGCALPAAQQQIVGVVWPVSGPGAVTIEVLQDGVSLATGSYQPTYTSSRPNGEDCEPTCSQAQLQPTLALP